MATPNGYVPIAQLSVGDLVYSVDRGALRPVPVAVVSRAPVASHVVMRATLENGAVLSISPGHPTADGRTFADLRVGGRLDGLQVTSSELVPYAGSFTYDILPASTTGTYVVSGALIGSTLFGLGVESVGMSTSEWARR